VAEHTWQVPIDLVVEVDEKMGLSPVNVRQAIAEKLLRLIRDAGMGYGVLVPDEWCDVVSIEKAQCKAAEEFPEEVAVLCNLHPGTLPELWAAVEGPTTGVGEETYYKYQGDSEPCLEYYVCNDQGHITTERLV
jgi:hypothetical protein